MKNILILLFIFFLNTSLFSQEKIEIIKTVKRTYVNERLYFLHTVKQGENLFAICKAYNVLQKEVAIENPKVFDGLQLGQVIKIPVINDGFGSIGAENYIIHKVNGGETLSAISRLYSVKVKKIKASNPGISDNLHIGQIIIISKDDIKNLSEATANIDKNYVIHIVQKRETLYSLSKQYGVEIDIIKQENPLVVTKGLQPDMRIRFSKKHFVLFTNPNDTIIKDTTLTELDSCLDEATFNKSKKYKIALLLPFNIDEKQLIKEKETKSRFNNIPKNKPFIEFYEGVLSATEMLRKEGFSLELFVYDYIDDSLSRKNIFNSISVNSIDLIIGPAYSSNFKLVSDFAKEKEIPIISPFANVSSIIETNEYAIQMYSNPNVNFDRFIKTIADTNNINFILIYDNFEKEKSIITNYKNIIFDVLATDSIGSNISYKENKYTKEEIIELNNSLTTDTNNLIIITTNEQAKISDIITKISISINENQAICLFSSASWDNYKNLDYNYLHKLNRTLLKSQYIDYERKNVKNYVFKFRNKFKNDPTHYTFLGYDLLNHFVKALASYDDIRCIGKYESNGLTTSFKLTKFGKGYINNSLYIVKFTPDFNIESYFVE